MSSLVLTKVFPVIADRVEFLAQLKRHEGEKLSAYLDTRGILTVGVGHNCIASPVSGVAKPGDKITQEASDRLFIDDVEKHITPLSSRLPWIEALSAPRQAVLYNMAFNLGVNGLLGFKNTLGMIEAGRYAAAADGMLNSRWATQVGRRSVELSRQMRTGKWQGVGA